MALRSRDMASPLPLESHGSATPAPNLGISFTDEDLLLPLAQRRNLRLHPHCHCWSKLPSDLIQLVFDRLGFADFQRAKCVCSSWRSVSRKSQPNNQIPWMIRFPKGNGYDYCLLFNPEEKDKMYKTPNLGNDFTKNVCVATYKSWFLMQPKYKHIDEDCRLNLYILDLLTRERINLPTFVSGCGLICSILWIDEKTKDHLVIGMSEEDHAISFKRGDNSWKQIPSLSGIEECFSMVFKDHKLYCLNFGKLKVFDFSGDTPFRVFKTSVSDFLQPPRPFGMRMPGTSWKDNVVHSKNKVVVTLAGDVLIVKCRRPNVSKIWEFKIYKMVGNNQWEEIYSLGDEAILLDLGITLLAKDMEGIQKNSIYFSMDTILFEDQYDKTEIFIFNLDSKQVHLPHRSVCSSFPCSRSRWFLPCFKRE
ncbi:hypothetical protein CARUB_v10006634mg [Capsella rubella]|uniref:F-box domain-containing protein n=2 Tax=Capsella rubella TaxID=81985 RepID=R0H0M4_9BRAS|nr:putative F-box protein At5g66830 isoform X2 [Capsella rubella]EOA18160.1 hypothetical protein CARUB_v10006634mg [Capsella rubella]